MASGWGTKLTGAAGEFLVAAELCRRGLVATTFAGNVPEFDIIASGKSGELLAIQVKAINEGSWQFGDIRKYVDVQLERDGKHQTIGNPQPEPYRGLLCVLVLLGEARRDRSRETEQDRFFVLKWKELRDVLVKRHRAHLSKHGYIRPRQPKSFHCSLEIADVRRFENRWDKILHRVS